MPWLLSVALIHGLLLQKRGSGWVMTNLFLSVSIFVLVLFSSFLTRSGILSSVSVHSFGASALALPLGFLTGVTACAAMTAAFVKGRGRFHSVRKQEKFREIVFGTGITALVFYAFVILAATLAPMFSLVFTGSPSIVKIGFFNSIGLVFALIFLISLATSLNWKKSEKYRGIKIAVFTIVTGAVTAVAVGGTPLAFVKYSAALSAGAILSIIIFISFTKPGIKKIPSLLAHAGFALFIAGTVGFSIRSDNSRIELPAGKPAVAGDAQFTFTGLREEKGKGFFSLDIMHKNNTIHAAIPFERMKDGSITGHSPFIVHGIYEDLYLYAEGFLSVKEIEEIMKNEKIEAIKADTLLLNLSHERLLMPVWIGGSLIFIGGMAGFLIRRKRR